MNKYKCVSCGLDFFVDDWVSGTKVVSCPHCSVEIELSKDVELVFETVTPLDASRERQTFAEFVRWDKIAGYITYEEFIFTKVLVLCHFVAFAMLLFCSGLLIIGGDPVLRPETSWKFVGGYFVFRLTSEFFASAFAILNKLKTK